MDPLAPPGPATTASRGAPRGFRVTGPGRLEREYQRRVDTLRGEVERRSKAVAALRRELEVAALVERGTGRLADRAERDLALLQQRASRLLVTLGAMQRENEALRDSLAAAEARLARLAAPRARRSPWWRRLVRGA